ncbi:MAG: hypothetical protein ACYC5O_16930 [Anaerolineae bacterium]
MGSEILLPGRDPPDVGSMFSPDDPPPPDEALRPPSPSRRGASARSRSPDSEAGRRRRVTRTVFFWPEPLAANSIDGAAA